MIRTILFVLLFSTTVASAEEYWVVGSYAVRENASVQAERIALESGLETEVRESESGLFRILIEKDSVSSQRNAIEDLGIEPWTLKAPSLERESVDMKPLVKAETDNKVVLGHAESGIYYLVLGGFSTRSAAESMVGRLEMEGVTGVHIANSRLSGVDYYRVVQGPHTDTSRQAKLALIDLGYADAWWSSKVADLLDIETEESTEPTVEKRKSSGPELTPSGVLKGTSRVLAEERKAPPPMKKEVPPAPKLSPPGAGESLVDYCVNRANALERKRYCANSQVLSGSE